MSNLEPVLVTKVNGYGVDEQGFFLDRAGILFIIAVPRSGVGLTHLLSTGYRELFPLWKSGRSLKLTRHLHLVPRLKMLQLYFHAPILYQIAAERLVGAIEVMYI
jgi:hypothetical protein